MFFLYIYYTYKIHTHYTVYTGWKHYSRNFRKNRIKVIFALERKSELSCHSHSHSLNGGGSGKGSSPVLDSNFEVWSKDLDQVK